MALITWSNKYSVNVKMIDSQHLKLVDLINKLHDGLAEGKSKDVLGGVLSELIKYTKEHFAAEEKLLAENGYVELLQHKNIHRVLTNKVVDYQKKFEEGRTAISIELMQFLKDWLLNHIMQVDKRYSNHLNSKGIN